MRRAGLILLLEDGESRDAITQWLGCDSRSIARWSRRFPAERMGDLYARHPGRAPGRAGEARGVCVEHHAQAQARHALE
ncbi:helix-turn-helix domain-containing protein [Cupriavidus basilensis]|uniref:helix-turn-helix domain-containing protein n=1 Tax=Cupriavidus basilensis TaxID=68895 RepID=UPI003D34C2F6